jgi:hypothetical protein
MTIAQTIEGQRRGVRRLADILALITSQIMRARFLAALEKVREWLNRAVEIDGFIFSGVPPWAVSLEFTVPEGDYIDQGLA